ncbi:MAG TPA: TonB-dependent receptor [Candidatus Acidoferrum sp.]|nr:TonB-dependent receptor [Candidatus Acidoferrum sp.]
MRFFRKLTWIGLLVCSFASAAVFASIHGSISGVVLDASGSAIVGADVTVTETQTNVKSQTTTDSKGFYNFPELPIGKYDVEIEANGFKTFRQTSLVVDANSALRVDATLQVGQKTESVVVNSDAVHVDLESTQNGEVIDGKKILAVPLNGRAYTDLLALQPGVVPSAYGNRAPDTQDRSPSGTLNPGNQSINGQRESSNGFMVNGANVVEGKNNGAAIVPNLDSIEEFRIITNNFDAEYGNYSGGQINVATRSGTNALHGSAFEFLRNTAFDARNFFNHDPGSTKEDFKQNQFGGTFGGPIKRNKLFFFVDYQGTRQTKGNVVFTNVPSNTAFPDATGRADALALFLAESPANPLNDDPTQPLPTSPSVNGSTWAQVLTNRLGYQIQAGEPYFNPSTVLDPTNFPGQPICTTSDVTQPNHCVFPNGIIPSSSGGISQVSRNILSFFPSASDPSGIASFTSSLAQRLRDDKGAVRVDANTPFGTISGYYFMDDFDLANPTPADIGANVPGFGDSNIGRAQLASVGITKTLSPTAINEFHLSYTRSAAHFGTPTQAVGGSDTLSSLGFVQPATVGGVFNGGIGPVEPSLDGVPSVNLGTIGTTIGVPSVTTAQFNNTYQVQDNFTKVWGTHTLKFGGQFHYDQINERNLFGQDGTFAFDGSETGVDWVDFLLGAVGGGGFTQASKQLLDSRSKYFGVFGQDSWRVNSGLTINFGLRWEFSQPWYDTQNKISTVVPGQQSVIFTQAPKGLVFPGDPGIPKTLAPTQYDAFSPRVGVAYSPRASEGFIAKLTGGPGKTSIRAGAGIFYTAFEDLSQFQEVGDIPFGLFWSPGGQKFFEAPFNDRVNGPDGQVFPFIVPSNATKAKPNTTFDFTPFEPLDGNAEVAFWHTNRLPYAEHFDLSIQRQFGANTVLSLGYVGTTGHKLIAFVNYNPSDNALCLFLNDPANLAPGSNVCDRNNEDSGPFVLAPGVSAPGYPGITSFASTRLLSGLNSAGDALVPFGRNAAEKTIANSVFHSFQATLKHTSTYGEFLIGYTYGKCLTNSSGLEDSVNPFDPRRSRGLCLFDVQHNFVGSYSVPLPFDKLFHANNGWSRRIAGGWQISGITTFATGIPISISEGRDVSLAGSSGTDVPNFAGGNVLGDTNPRNSNPYFNTALFSKETLGHIGNSRRRFFHGPGLNNWDMALLKDISFTETKQLQLRFESFNTFNHAQFENPTGSIDSSTFGQITGAHDPRILQVSGKFRF